MAQQQQSLHGDQKLASLAQDLRDPRSDEVRCRAANSLSQLGPSAVPVLLDALQDPEADQQTRELALIALEQNALHQQLTSRPIEPLDDIVSSLCRAIGAPESVVRYRALYALRTIGPTAAAALPSLLQLGREGPPDAATRVEVIRAVAAVGPSSADVLDYLLAAWECGRDWERAEAMAALARMEDRSRTVPALLRALGARSKRVRRQAAFSLGRLTPEATAAIPALKKILRRDPDPTLRAYAATSLGTIGREAEGILTALARALCDERAEVRAAAVYELAYIRESPTREQIPALTGLLTDRKRSVRQGAARVLQRIGRQAAAVETTE